MPAELDHTVLMETLGLAVPMWMTELHAGRVSPTRSDLAVNIGQLGDALMFGSPKRGNVEVAFNALAKGLALLAFQPGGVTFRERHWCVDHAYCLDPTRTFNPPKPPQPAMQVPRQSVRLVVDLATELT